jgi:transposase-like protein
MLKSSSMPSVSNSSLEEISEGARRASAEISSSAGRPDPEVAAVARRRRFSYAQKVAILAEADRCAPGQLGALLRQKGIYSSMLSAWRKQCDQGQRKALASQKRGPKPNPQARQIQHLNRDNARLRRKLERAEIIIEAQKKLCIALGLPTADDREQDD